MHQIVRDILSRYLTTGRIPAVEELGLVDHPLLARKDLVFVTLYRAGSVIASSGRVHLKKSNSLLELVENSLLCLKDERIGESMRSPDALSDVRIRVDTIAPNKRVVVTSLVSVDPQKHGLILLSEGRSAIGVVLPGMSRVATTAEELFFLVCKKAGVDPDAIAPEEYVLYTVESEISSDF